MNANSELYCNNSKSVLWHFASRNSRFPDDDLDTRPDYLAEYERRATQRFAEKWGRLPDEDADTFVVPIYNTNVKTRLKWDSKKYETN